MKLLTDAEVAQIGKLAHMVETTPFPNAWYFEDEAAGLRSIARQLRQIVGLPEPAPLWPELAANAEPIPKEETP